MYISALSSKKMKNLILICIIFLTTQCSSGKEAVLKNNTRATKNHQTEVILFNKPSRIATIGNTNDEKILSVYLYDKKRNLLKSFEDIKVNKFILNVQGVYLINVVTDKGLHMKIIK